MKKNILNALLFLPTIVFALAYFITRNDLATSTAITNLALPAVLIEMVVMAIISAYRNKSTKSTKNTVAKKIIVAFSALMLIVMVSSVGFAQAGVAGSLLNDTAYIYGGVKVYVAPNLQSYAFHLSPNSATYFKDQAQRVNDDATNYIKIFGGGTMASFAANYFRQFLKLPAKYNPLGAIIAGVTTGLTMMQIDNMNRKIQQDYSPTQGIALLFTHQNVQIYNWYGYKWEVLYNGDEFVSYACAKMSSLYGTGDWATYFGCEVIWT